MIFVLSFIIILVLVAGMSVGVIFSNRPIKGTCGGMAAMGIGQDCDICGGDLDKCEEENAKKDDGEKTDLAYDASKDEK